MATATAPAPMRAAPIASASARRAAAQHRPRPACRAPAPRAATTEAEGPTVLQADFVAAMVDEVDAQPCDGEPITLHARVNVNGACRAAAHTSKVLRPVRAFFLRYPRRARPAAHPRRMGRHRWPRCPVTRPCGTSERALARASHAAPAARASALHNPLILSARPHRRFCAPWLAGWLPPRGGRISRMPFPRGARAAVPRPRPARPHAG